MEAKEILGGLGGYLSFASRLLRSPPDALEPYRAHGKVAEALIGSAVGGVVLAWLLVLAVDPAVFDDDPAWIVAQIRRIGRVWMPVVAVAIVGVFAILFHAVARAALWVSRLGRRENIASIGGAYLGGKIEDSINAALAFAAIFIPLMCGVVLGVSLAGRAGAEVSIALILLPVSAAFFAVVYFPWCLAGTHPETNWLQAFFSVSLTFVAAYVLLDALS